MMPAALTLCRHERPPDGKHDVLLKVKTAQATKFIALPVG
jgi:hypothetical protein